MPRKNPRVPLHEHGRLAPPAAGAWLSSISVGAAGEIVTVWVAGGTGDARTTFGSADDGLPCRTDVVVAAYRTTEPCLVVRVDGLRLRFPEAQVVPDGILLVGSRCSRRGGVAEQNAEVRDVTGARLRRGCLGDGIAMVRATPRGDVWAGYFDEGVYGNLGWGGDVAPLGAPGVVLWSGQDFTPLWAPEPDVDDAYAATLVGEDLWASTYTDFPLRIYTNGTERTLPTSDAGTRALITDGATVATVGEYGDAATFRIYDLSVDTQRGPRAKGRLDVPRGTKDVQLMGHGDRLHVFAGDHWSSVTLAEIRDAAG